MIQGTEFVITTGKWTGASLLPQISDSTKWSVRDGDLTAKERITLAFKALRKRGFITKQNFLCCGGCASYSIGEQIEKKHGKNTPEANAQKAVFYHRQNAEAFNEYGEIEGWLHLSWFSDETKTEAERLEVAVEIAEELLAQGFEVEIPSSHMVTVIVAPNVTRSRYGRRKGRRW